MQFPGFCIVVLILLAACVAAPAPAPSPTARSQSVSIGLTCSAWDKIPTIAISAPEGDARIGLALEAIDFWNEQLAEIEVPFRLGSVIHTIGLVPDEYLVQASETLLSGGPGTPPSRLPDTVRTQADLIVAISNAQFLAFGHCPRPGSEQPVIVGIGIHRAMHMPNVDRNVIAHELGHAIFLGHNSDPTTLMCGRPAPCRPAAFQSEEERFFPLSEQDKLRLRSLYNPMWWPPRR